MPNFIFTAPRSVCQGWGLAGGRGPHPSADAPTRRPRPRLPFNSTPMAVNPISSGSPQYAPWGVRVVSQTKSRKIPTRKYYRLFFTSLHCGYSARCCASAATPWQQRAFRMWGFFFIFTIKETAFTRTRPARGCSLHRGGARPKRGTEVCSSGGLPPSRPTTKQTRKVLMSISVGKKNKKVRWETEAHHAGVSRRRVAEACRRGASLEF